MYPCTSSKHPILQDDLYRADYYQSLMEFREQTYQRLKKYSKQQFFKTEHYLQGGYTIIQCGVALNHQTFSLVAARSGSLPVHLCLHGSLDVIAAFVSGSPHLALFILPHFSSKHCHIHTICSGYVQIHGVSWLASKC